VEVEHCQPQTTDESALIVDVAQVRAGLEDSAVIPTKQSKDNLKRKIPHDGFEEPEKPVNSVSHSSLNVKDVCKHDDDRSSAILMLVMLFDFHNFTFHVSCRTLRIYILLLINVSRLLPVQMYVVIAMMD